MTRVLIVDDEEGIRKLMRRMLEDAGYEVAEAEDSDAALARLAEQPAAAAFCDIQMPGHDGLWLTAEIRKTYPMTAVILATGVSTVPANISMQHGVLAYLVKPFTRARVLKALESALAWHDAAVVTPPAPEPLDLKDRLQDWLDHIDDQLPPAPEGSTLG